METMKAYTHTLAGPPSEVLTRTAIPKPRIESSTQVLVRITHCALNPGASIVMQLLPFLFRASPAIPEMDFSGIIVEIGSDVANMRPGSEVFGSIPIGQHVKSTCGALAEYVVVDRNSIVRKPEFPSLSEAAGLGIAGATALELVKAAKLREGDAVLVNGAGGGIGHLVLQMCWKKVGPSGKVVAICSQRSNDWVRKLGTGADSNDSLAMRFQVIDREATPLVPYLIESFGRARFDVVIDAVGIQDIYNHSPSFLKDNAPYITVGPKAYSYTYLGLLSTLGRMATNALWPRILGGTPRPYIQVAAVSNLAALEELAVMVEEGALKVHVGALVEWESVLHAYAQIHVGHASGKVVVVVGNDHDPVIE